MKTHFAVVRENKYGGHSYRTLCGRSSMQFEGDGINDTADWSEVTCKFCLKLRRDALSGSAPTGKENDNG